MVSHLADHGLYLKDISLDFYESDVKLIGIKLGIYDAKMIGFETDEKPVCFSSLL